MTTDTSPEEMVARIQNAGFISEVENYLRPLSYEPRTWWIVLQVLEDLTRGHLSDLQGSADEWFNLAIRAAKIRATTVEMQILQTALDIYPENVDLLCSLFQAQYSHSRDSVATETWARLEGLGLEKTGPYWRYWVYGATYWARYRHDLQKAVALLDEGLIHVRHADLINLYRSYRTVLLDGATLASPASLVEAREARERSLDLLEEKYREGISLGIETGYILAVDLARLLRERAARNDDSKSTLQLIDEALGYLDLAEALFTNDANHPISDIYVERVIALMARHRYSDAFNIFESLREQGLLLGGSLEVMAGYAARQTGRESQLERRNRGVDVAEMEPAPLSDAPSNRSPIHSDN